jgi:L-ribulose-5-phosphate 4-epimerase
MLENLKEEVCQANVVLFDKGLVTLTFGNVSGIDRDKRLLVIKPSGIPYKELMPGYMAVVDLDGKVVEGNYKPSMDAPSHAALYKAWPEIGGVTHTHSTCATMFAQACRPIPCLGTTHADYFRGEVPVTRSLTGEEINADYERKTGELIIERFDGLDPLETPAVLVANHGPFTWGPDAAGSVENCLVLEYVAEMALGTLQINPGVKPIKKHLLDKHYLRKHGPGAYYGQKPK